MRRTEARDLVPIAPRAIARPRVKVVQPMRGGWEVLQPIFGDETEDDCGSWLWHEAAIAVGLVAVLVAIFAGWI